MEVVHFLDASITEGQLSHPVDSSAHPRSHTQVAVRRDSPKTVSAKIVGTANNKQEPTWWNVSINVGLFAN